MEIGISTASLFKRQYNEDALVTLDGLGARVVEVFLGSYCEYTKEFATLLKSRQGSLKVHSIHTLNTHFEPQLFGDNPRAIDDAYRILENCLSTANTLGATNYTLHGIARFKKNCLRVRRFPRQARCRLRRLPAALRSWLPRDIRW